LPVERAAGGTSLIDVLDRVLDKGIVIDAWVRVSLVGIDLITVEARIVVASIDTYLKYYEAVGQVAPVSKPAVEGKGYEEVMAENAALRAQLQSAALSAALLAGGAGQRHASKRNGTPATGRRGSWPAVTPAYRALRGSLQAHGNPFAASGSDAAALPSKCHSRLVQFRAPLSLTTLDIAKPGELAAEHASVTVRPNVLKRDVDRLARRQH
jgi:hypothetical protein